MDIYKAINAGRAVAIGVNPKPHVTHKFFVERGLRLYDNQPPDGVDPSDWIALLDHWDTDQSVGLQRGVVYLQGDPIEVDRFEAADIAKFIPAGYFKPADPLTEALVAAVQAPEG